MSATNKQKYSLSAKADVGLIGLRNKRKYIAEKEELATRSFIGHGGPAGLLFFLWKSGVRVYYSAGSFILLARLGHGVFYSAKSFIWKLRVLFSFLPSTDTRCI